MEEGTNVPIPQMDPTANTAVQRLSGPSQMVKDAVVDLINYQVCLSVFELEQFLPHVPDIEFY